MRVLIARDWKLMALRPVALTGYTTTHTTVYPAGAIDPLTGSPTTTTPEGFGLALVGPTLITAHVFVGPGGAEIHTPNPIVSPGSIVTKVDGLPVAFIGDAFA
jgi:uncharacterized Zn-binding protein involved in type VI secretion